MGRRRRASSTSAAAVIGMLGGLLLTSPAWSASPDNALLSPRYTVDDADANRLLGPLLFYHRSPSRLELGVRPLFSFARTQPGWHDTNLLYPALAVRTRPIGQNGQILQFVSWSTRTVTDGPSEIEWMLFPLLAYQSATPQFPVGFALFPLYGSLHHYLWQERLQFTLFPLWLSLERDQISRRFILWPFFSWATAASETAPRARGWKVWPLYGELHQEGIRKNRFVLWPFFIHEQSDLDTDTPQEEILMLPFYRAIRSPEKSSTWWFLFFGHIVDIKSHYEEWALPWPLIQFGKGDERSISRVFPFYSARTRTHSVELLGKTNEVRVLTRVVLSPLYRETSEIGPDWRRDRRRVLLFLYSDLRERRHDGQTDEPPREARRIDLWPLFTYNETADGAVAFQTLAPLEAFLNTEPLTRNYSPLWSLATYRRDADGGTGLAFLWGLIQWRSTSEEQQLRLLYLPRLRWQRSAAPASPISAQPDHGPPG